MGMYSCPWRSCDAPRARILAHTTPAPWHTSTPLNAVLNANCWIGVRRLLLDPIQVRRRADEQCVPAHRRRRHEPRFLRPARVAEDVGLHDVELLPARLHDVPFAGLVGEEVEAAAGVDGRGTEARAEAVAPE